MLSLLFHSQMLAIHTYYFLVLTKILARQASLFLFHRWSNWRCGRGSGWLQLTEHEQRKDRNCRAYSTLHTLQQGGETAPQTSFIHISLLHDFFPPPSSQGLHTSPCSLVEPTWVQHAEGRAETSELPSPQAPERNQPQYSCRASIVTPSAPFPFY